MLSLPLPTIRRARMPIVERALRECLAALPNDGRTFSTTEIMGLLVGERTDPEAREAAAVLGGSLADLANAIPGLADRGEPELGTGPMASRMIRRWRWSYRPIDGRAAVLIDAAVAEATRAVYATVPPLPRGGDVRLAMAEKRIDRLEAVLTRYGYPLGEIV